MPSSDLGVSLLEFALQGKIIDGPGTFEYSTLVTGTKNFSEELGKGCFGSVYKGVLLLPDGMMEVAVKKNARGAAHGVREFQNEVNILLPLHHPNVVRLYGHCNDDNGRLLVYEYVANQSLLKVLSSDTTHGTLLSWPQRHSVMVHVARGLHYLHKGFQTPIIHGDIKADNILLDKDWVAKIGDFGMACLSSEEGTHASSQLDIMEDVYNYGVVLLQLISGKLPRYHHPYPDWKKRELVGLAWKLYADQPLEMLHPVLKSTAYQDEVILCTKIALLCTQSDPTLRPDMEKVGLFLSGELSIEEPCKPETTSNGYWDESDEIISSDYSGEYAETISNDYSDESDESSGDRPNVNAVGEVMDDYAGFQYEILRTATRNFSDILGEGCSGPIFKGVLPDGREVAVKKLEANLQGEREFQNEVTVLSRLQHTNVVQLYGYCIHDSERLLVYAYATNQSLRKLLSYGTSHVTLSWEKRYSIMVDVAQGLLYLHKGTQTPIIHGDIKIDNILLCENEVTKIDDFGMARLFPMTHVGSQLDSKCGSLMEDVYSYGVVLLELISREIPSIPDRERRVIVEWAWKLCIDKKQPLQILDPVLKDTANLDQVMMCIKIALICTEPDPSLRPDMQQVVDLLSGESSSSIGKSCSIQNKRRRTM